MLKISKVFKRHARSDKIEMIDWKDPLAQLKASKASIKDLFKDILDGIKGFEYQITAEVLLSKNKENVDIEFTPVYFNSNAKTLINSDKYMLD